MQRRDPSQRARSMPKSAIREIMSLAAGREGVIHLEVGEPNFTTPVHIVEQAGAAARDGWTHYTANAGIPSLRAQIARRVGQRIGAEVEPERIVVTVGAIGALYTAIMTVVDAGDEVLIPDPGWPNYESIVHLAGATPVRFPLPASEGFLPDLDDLAGRIGPRTKALMLNTPSNPTGVVLPREAMQELAALADRQGLYLISDEIYEDILFEGEHVSAGSLGLEDRVFIVSGVSKSYAMTGWRIGYLVCPPDLAEIAVRLQEPITSCASSVSQKAAEAALAGPQNCVAEGRRIFQRRRDLLLDVLGNTGLLPVTPAGPFYALVDIGDRHEGSVEFAKAFLLEQNVATVPGLTFGPSCDGTIRVAFTIADEQLRTGLERLRTYIRGN